MTNVSKLNWINLSWINNWSLSNWLQFYLGRGGGGSDKISRQLVKFRNPLYRQIQQVMFRCSSEWMAWAKQNPLGATSKHLSLFLPYVFREVIQENHPICGGGKCCCAILQLFCAALYSRACVRESINTVNWLHTPNSAEPGL